MIQHVRHAINVARAALHEAKKRSERSTRWPTVEHHYKNFHPTCAACGGTVRLQVHHKQPFHLFPDLELDPDNLIGLCMGPKECHLAIGHGGSFKKWNPKVAQHAAAALRTPDTFDAIVIAARAAALT